MMIVNADDTGKMVEMSTFTCMHCNQIVPIKPMCDPVELGGRCGGCDGLLCKRCAALDGCSHIEKRLEKMEHRAAALRSMLG